MAVTTMWIEIFFYSYIGIAILLALKRYIPSLKKLFNNHPIGEWGMYSVPVESLHYIAEIGIKKAGFEDFKPLADITSLSEKYLWHNFNKGQFVSIAHPDFPQKAFREFSVFLAQQKEVKKIADNLHSKTGKEHADLAIEVFFSYKIVERRFSYTSSSKL